MAYANEDDSDTIVWGGGLSSYLFQVLWLESSHNGWIVLASIQVTPEERQIAKQTVFGLVSKFVSCTKSVKGYCFFASNMQQLFQNWLDLANALTEKLPAKLLALPIVALPRSTDLI